MSFVEIVVYIFGFWMVLQVAQFVMGAIAFKEVQVKIRDHLEKIIHEVVVEKQGEVEYWFDKETDQFLAQGKSIEELTNHVRSRFPDHIFIVKPKGVLCAPKWEFVEKVDPSERAEYYANK